MEKIQARMQRSETMWFPLKTQTHFVSLNSTNSFLVGYDLGNNPELYQYTRRAKYDAAKTGTLRTTMGDAGRHALSNATNHWQSEYGKKVEEVQS